MSTITASAVKELREKTGVGMMECKKALEATNGDLEEAVKWLREKGLAAATKKADRETREGIVACVIAGQNGGIVELNCETDFVAKSDDFVALAANIAKAIAETPGVASVDDLEKLTINGRALKEAVSEVVLKIGENVQVKRLGAVRTSGALASYIHMGGKIGVLVEFNQPVSEQLGKDIAMQVAAASPSYVNRDQVPSAEVENEKQIFRTQALNDGKPEKVIDKMIDGKVAKYYKEVCLIEQEFVKNPEQTIQQVLPAGVQILSFERFSIA